MKQHTPETIAAALRGQLSVEECDQLARTCETLRVERRARLADISPTYPGLPISKQSATYRDTYLADPVALKREQEQLRSEIDYLDSLEFMCAEAREAAVTERARNEIPKAVKRLPTQIKTALAALEQLEQAIAAANVDLACIAEFERLEGKTFPFDDDRLAALLELRNRLWQPVLLQVPTHLPGDPESAEAQAYPKSWALSYKQRGVNGPAVTSRRPPKDINPFDYSSEPVVRIRAK